MIDSPPEIHHLAVDLDVHFIEMPPPVPETAHPAYPLATDIAGKHRAEPVPPEPNRLVAQINTPFEQQILDIPQREWEAHIHEDNQPDHLG